MKKIVKKSGIALIEAIIAVTMMATGAMILGTIIQNISNATIASRDRLVATNLIEEAIEGVRNIRSTNWILYPNEPNCYMDLAHKCTSGNPENEPNTSHFYRLYFDSENDLWVLEDQMLQDLDLSEGETGMQEYRLYKHYDADNDYTIYTNETGTFDEASQFYRQISFISYSSNSTDIEIKIQWKDGAKIQTITRFATLYNFN